MPMAENVMAPWVIVYACADQLQGSIELAWSVAITSDVLLIATFDKRYVYRCIMPLPVRPTGGSGVYNSNLLAFA